MSTISIKNRKQPAPRKFLKVKKAISRLSNAAVVILLMMGFTENSMAIVICRVGVDAILDAAETMLAE